jgi:hypothetical protein
VWDSSSVRAILLNPRYTGRQVWRRTKGSEVLSDPEDVAFGYVKKYQRIAPEDWLFSANLMHAPLIGVDTWAAAIAEFGQGKARRPVIAQTDVRHTYALRGLVRCALCGRLMEGDTFRNHARYRCRLSGNRAIDPVLAVGHPKHTSVREDKITPVLDAWLASAFDPKQIETTIAALVAVDVDPLAEHRAQRAREQIADFDERIARYKALLDQGGVEASVVGPWITDARAKRAIAERDLILASEHEPTTAAELRAMIASMGSIRRRLAKADPNLKAAVYRELGVGITVTPGANTFRVTVLPPTPTLDADASPQVKSRRGKMCVGGGT